MRVCSSNLFCAAKIMKGPETEKEDFGLFLSGLFRSRPQSVFRFKIPCLGISNSLLCDTFPLKPLVTPFSLYICGSCPILKMLYMAASAQYIIS